MYQIGGRAKLILTKEKRKNILYQKIIPHINYNR